MDNLMVGTLLESYVLMLDSAIAKIEKDLPADEKIQGKNWLNQDVEDIPILAPLYEVRNHLAAATKRLVKPVMEVKK